MPDLIRVPYLGTAEEDVLLATWLVAEGEAFRKGDALAAVETLKAAFEIEAERDGVLHRQVVPAGERVAVQGVVGIARASSESVSADDEAALLASVEDEADDTAGPVAQAATREPAAPSRGGAAGDVEAAPAARMRARELGIDLAAVCGTGAGGLIRLEDVERHVAEGKASVPIEDPTAGDGWLSAEFTELLDRDRAAFAALGSASKVAIYRRFGARLGADVSFGSNAVIRARRLVLGDGSHVGANVTIDCEELVAGRLACFGRNSVLRSRRIELGDNAFFAPDVEVGGGGAMEPEAELVVGSNGFIGERSHLNPCRRLEIGDEVVISRSAVIMTHSFGGSVLDGYPNRFAPVRIGSRCQVGIGAMLFPGVEMGEGSILLSNSTLVTSMPAGRMFAGVPATDLRAAAHPPSDAQRAGIVRDLVAEFARQLGLRGHRVVCDSNGDRTLLTLTTDRGEHRLHLAAVAPPDHGELPREQLWVTAAALGDDRFAAAPPELCVFDLGTPRIRGPEGPLHDAFREFLRKRGVRLGAWTYRGGLL